MSSQEQPSLDLGSEHMRPITEDEDYPPLLREIASILQREIVGLDVGIAPPRAAAIAETLTEFVRERFGGQQLYWAKGHTMRQRHRRAAMWADFNGHNQVELAQKYGVSMTQVYRSLALARAEDRTQPDLFAGSKPGADKAGI